MDKNASGAHTKILIWDEPIIADRMPFALYYMYVWSTSLLRVAGYTFHGIFSYQRVPYILSLQLFVFVSNNFVQSMHAAAARLIAPPSPHPFENPANANARPPATAKGYMKPGEPDQKEMREENKSNKRGSLISSLVTAQQPLVVLRQRLPPPPPPRQTASVVETAVR